MTRKKLLKIALGIPLVLGLLAFGAQEAVYQWSMRGHFRRLRDGVSKHIDTFLEDQLALMPLDVFHIDQTGKDAGPFLNPRVRWGAGQKDGARYLAGTTGAPIAPIPDKIAAELQSAPENWLGGGPEFQYNSYDFSWMREALGYSHWELSESPNVKAMFEKAKNREVMFLNYQAAFPLPELRDLVNHAKLRLMKAMAQKELPVALAETRHLARLFYSTETLYGALMSVAMLGTERVAYEYGVARKMISAGDWKPIPIDLHGKMKRAILGAWGFYGYWAEPEQVRRTLGSPNAPVGKCAAIREGTTYASALREHLYPQFPLEKNYQEVYDELKTVALDPANGCRLRDVKAYWEDPSAFFSLEGRSPAEFLTISGRDKAFWIGAAMASYRFPYLRRAGGLWLGTLGVPDAFTSY